VGVDIDDLRDRNRTIHANSWQWGSTVELIRSLGIFDGERLDHLSNGFGEFSAEEARRLGVALEQYLTPDLRSGERVHPDGTVTAEPDDYTFHRAPKEQFRDYFAHHDWLVAFIVFCKQSNGLYVC